MASNIGGAGQLRVPEMSFQQEPFPIEELPEEVINKIARCVMNEYDDWKPNLEVSKNWGQRVILAVEHNTISDMHQLIDYICRSKISDQDKAKVLGIAKQQTILDCTTLNQVNDSYKDVQIQLVQLLKNYPEETFTELKAKEPNFVNLVDAYRSIEKIKNDATLSSNQKNIRLYGIYTKLVKDGFPRAVIELASQNTTMDALSRDQIIVDSIGILKLSDLDRIKLVIEKIKTRSRIFITLNKNLSIFNYKEAKEVIDKMEDSKEKATALAAYCYWMYDADIDPDAKNLISKLPDTIREDVSEAMFDRLIKWTPPNEAKEATKKEMLQAIVPNLSGDMALLYYEKTRDIYGLILFLNKEIDDPARTRLAETYAGIEFRAGNLNNFQKIVDAFKLDPKKFG